MTIEVELRDVGNGLVDSAVLLDNFVFSAVEYVDPQRSGLSDDVEIVSFRDFAKQRGVARSCPRPPHSPR